MKKKKALKKGLRLYEGKELSKDFPITILSSTPLSLNAKLIVFELYKMRYIVILNQNGATLVDKYPIEDFGELFKQEKQ